MRKPIIAANWKMNKTVSEAAEFARELKDLAKDIFSVEIVVCPPFIALGAVGEVLRNTNIRMGAQNMHWEKSGAFTGEISPVMLRDLGCRFVIIGHSERRGYFQETNKDINKKMKSAFSFNLTPIMCVGEKLEERESKSTLKVVEKQIKEGLAEIGKEEIKSLVVAYEPIWAIGTGKTATPADASEVHAHIRSVLSSMHDSETAQQVRIQYGGSVTPESVGGLMKEEGIDGALVGGASLNVNSFLKIIQFNNSRV
ncbi:triose-phosphate isomerase [Candidatus Desantisbacteria bacterium CG_4_10_14_0_8_um_filter_48_22]|uniref:Triosephosphate isomerase n=1 Tax=Candidatus Desantisbacteria bacterium CG_4_10_14_0_8_um_filter_48_22 TaxID=1974543 RepID=A0A2M7SES8_9BACT|nr:MAG: triose-phosphate isomerase [Candidatus Desantisbacteria bacterium CG1_02_49_89]PIV55368.1 MAG: triose-phosphate isomerase [Candidatus Desantisbacteria bacterium CG02_land_8_20_14_3_00_49_13]PIZ17984.1 MAG: triose-phosphate isomerase [Candidatus Desantisbacteria bacterium CG_4_10_14_0_8_um_filter_48_22]PJB28515.1 MAG: triose-phosphate isomerase [Candidatus Desantisbacteria bacterium CG_4_9_14_3_um_filter_50_7]